MVGMSTYSVRTFGDPVLKQMARDVDQIDGALARLVDDMVDTMYAAVGAGLAAPQVGVQKRLFVYDVGEGPEVMINPAIVETAGEWYHEEGCLSIPDLRLGIVRPMEVHIRGYDLDGEEVSIEADEFLGRVFQHEADHDAVGPGRTRVVRPDDATLELAVHRSCRLQAVNVEGALPNGINENHPLPRSSALNWATRVTADLR